MQEIYATLLKPLDTKRNVHPARLFDRLPDTLGADIAKSVRNTFGEILDHTLVE